MTDFKTTLPGFTACYLDENNRIFANDRIMKMMKKLLTTLLIALASFVAVVGCSKPEPQVNNDEYYVKYLFEATNNVGYSRYWDCNISFSDEKGQVEMAFPTVNSLSYEVITGPFSRNAKVYATLDGGGFPNTSIQIFVSKNNSPFALKCLTNEDRLEYTIDY